MASRKIWKVRFVFGNPKMFTAVRNHHGNPMTRFFAIREASVIADKGWRCWVENENGARIFESEAEVKWKSENSPSLYL